MRHDVGRRLPDPPLCRESTPLCRKNALVWNDLSSHCGTAPAGRAAVGGSCDGGSLWYSRIAREGAGMVWIRRELPRTIRREFGLGLIA